MTECPTCGTEHDVCPTCGEEVEETPEEDLPLVLFMLIPSFLIAWGFIMEMQSGNRIGKLSMAIGMFMYSLVIMVPVSISIYNKVTNND